MAERSAELKKKAFDKEIEKLDKELNEAIPDPLKIEQRLKVVYNKAEALFQAQQKVLEAHFVADDDDKYLEAEEKLSEYQVELDTAERNVSAVLCRQPAVHVPDSSRVTLPQLKLQEFNGDIRQWLRFWASFEDIHKNRNLSDSDKFQYLLQCVPATSPARKCIEGFPVCGKNYKNAVDALLNTYGRKSTLVKVYIRDLLQLVTKNATEKTRIDILELVPLLISQIRNLEELGVTSDKCEMVLYPIIESCLPDDVLQAWQRHAKYAETLEEIVAFLNTEVQNKMKRSLARMDFSSSSGGSEDKKMGKRQASKPDVATASALIATSGDFGNAKTQRQCIFCEGKKHGSQSCQKARNEMTPKQRQDVLRKKQACFSCLKMGHRSTECPSTVVCSICKGKHFEIMCRNHELENKPEDNRTMMVHKYNQKAEGAGYYGCGPSFQYAQPQQQYYPPQVFSSPPHVPVQQPPQESTVVVQQPSAGNYQQGSSSRPNVGFSNVTGRKQVAMLTLLVYIETPRGCLVARAFIDEGSEESYIEENVASAAQCPIVGMRKMQHQLFGGGVTKPQQHRLYSVQLRALDGTGVGCYNFNSVARIAQSIPKPPAGDWVQKLLEKKIMLHDQSRVGDSVQLLIGLDIAAQIFTGNCMRVDRFLLARETIFGWVVGGSCITAGTAMMPTATTTTQMVTSFMLGNMNEEDLWSLELIGITDEARTQSREDLESAAMRHFEENVVQLSDGRYECRLPWIEGHRKLLSNRAQATARLSNLTKSLRSDGYLEAYDEVIRTWLADGVVEVVPEGEESDMEYFLPHRHVIKEHSTTPVRPVFDASSKAKGSPSLNDCLERGPNLLEIIPACISRFRRKKIGVVSDVKKAFLQVSVNKDDRKVLQFLWYKDKTCKQLLLLRHMRAVFGVTSSPFLLAATIRHHIKKHAAEYPDIADMLLESFYVDNSVSSHCTEESALDFKRQAVELMSRAMMDLRGWEYGPSDEERSVPVLGMIWNLRKDTLSLCLDGTLKKMEAELTKRGLLSAINSVFDPMGFAQPFSIVPKFLFQKCCTLKMGWDDPLPEDISTAFLKWKSQVPALQLMEIPRWMCNVENEKGVSFQIFSDASQAAYSACLFIRTESVEGGVTAQLVMCRSRVAPSKTKMTIPRLELLGCLLGVRLAEEVKKYFSEPDVPCIFHTDSSTALAWICNEKPLARFVQNRVDEIRRYSKPEQWRHIPGEENPADLPSRGCHVERLLQLQWWEGPQWLRRPPEEWPKSSVITNEEEIISEFRRTVVSSQNLEKKDVLDHLRKFSNYHTAVRVTSIVLRYVNILKARVEYRKEGEKKLKLQKTSYHCVPESTVDELERAEKCIWKFIQRTSFSGTSDRRLAKLGAFEDADGIVRVQSQLYFGEEQFALRCPVVLPPDHEVVKALIWTEHMNSCHAGVQTTIAILRKKFWIVKARRAVGGIITACAICRRFVARRCEVPTCPLPFDRIRNTTAFDVTGVDLFGPMYLIGGEKVWVVLFTCAVYRCVHLEVTLTLSTPGFLASFRRFVSRRGRPSRIYSDNGLNFVGCHNLFRNLDWEHVKRYAAVDKIEWIFNPPTASWWGGFWEWLVGLTKRLLRRVLGKKVVCLEELTTILCDVEANLNMRPLTYLSENDKLMPLAPANFLHDNGVGRLPEADVIDGKSLRKSLNRCQELRQQLRGRFRSEYLGQLKYQATHRVVDMNVGDVVIIENEDKKRIDWQLGVVKALYHGRDGRSRTALVKTKEGELLRPLQRLFILESALSPDKEETDPALDGESLQDAADEEVKERQGVVTRYGRKSVKPEKLHYK